MLNAVKLCHSFAPIHQLLIASLLLLDTDWSETVAGGRHS